MNPIGYGTSSSNLSHVLHKFSKVFRISEFRKKNIIIDFKDSLSDFIQQPTLKTLKLSSAIVLSSQIYGRWAAQLKVSLLAKAVNSGVMAPHWFQCGSGSAFYFNAYPDPCS